MRMRNINFRVYNYIYIYMRLFEELLIIYITGSGWV